MRQIVLDVETTGLEAAAGHRIIEIGCVELLNRRPTGQKFHRYLNPEREIDAGALAVHGIELARLLQAPRFAEISLELLAFIEGAELIIHNAPFDVGFLDAELARLPGDARTVAGLCKVLDTLALARSLHPGQRNSLDALCKRYGVDNTRRDLHGALLDAGILVDVYLAMTGGQGTFALDMAGESRRSQGANSPAPQRASGVALVVPLPGDEELRQHEALLDLIHKASGGKVLWRPEPARDGDGTHINH